MIPYASDASRAVVTMAAQRIAAFADREGISIEQIQCEDLAEDLMYVYQAFLAGVRHGAGNATTAGAEPLTPAKPGEL